MVKIPQNVQPPCGVERGEVSIAGSHIRCEIYCRRPLCPRVKGPNNIIGVANGTIDMSDSKGNKIDPNTLTLRQKRLAATGPVDEAVADIKRNCGYNGYN